MKLTPNPYACHFAARGGIDCLVARSARCDGCLDAETHDLAVKATLEDVARDLETDLAVRGHVESHARHFLQDRLRRMAKEVV